MFSHIKVDLENADPDSAAAFSPESRSTIQGHKGRTRTQVHGGGTSLQWGTNGNLPLLNPLINDNDITRSSLQYEDRCWKLPSCNSPTYSREARPCSAVNGFLVVWLTGQGDQWEWRVLKPVSPHDSVIKNLLVFTTWLVLSVSAGGSRRPGSHVSSVIV